MNSESDIRRGKIYKEPIGWCGYIIKLGYLTSAIIIFIHIIWYFAARKILEVPRSVYLKNYIILPTIGLFALTFLVGLYVSSDAFSIFSREFLSLSLFIIFSCYLIIVHDMAKVLMGSFIIPIFVSTIFSDEKITRCMFYLSNISIFIIGVKMYLCGQLELSAIIQLLVALFMLLSSYLLAKIIIRYSYYNQATIENYDYQQRYMKEQLKLDLFTGLYNRKTFDLSLPDIIKECQKTKLNLSLAILDIDYFKCINDIYGHMMGNQVLLNLSQMIKNIESESIHGFRIGGDEFAIILRDCDEETAKKICENLRIRMEFESMNNKDRKRVTISCGIACMDQKELSKEELEHAADLALYKAKSKGRNCCLVYKDTGIF